MDLKPSSELWSIALVGAFNPVIFSPEWMVANGIVPENDVETLRVAIGQGPQVVSYRAEWFNLEVTLGRFLIETLDNKRLPSLYDFVVRAFALLHHSPINMVVCVIERRYSVAPDRLERLLSTYAPTSPWKALNANVLSREVTTRLSFGDLQDGEACHVTIEDSLDEETNLRMSMARVVQLADRPTAVEGSHGAMAVLAKLWSRHVETGGRILTVLADQ